MREVGAAGYPRRRQARGAGTLGAVPLVTSWRRRWAIAASRFASGGEVSGVCAWSVDGYTTIVADGMIGEQAGSVTARGDDLRQWGPRQVIAGALTRAGLRHDILAIEWRDSGATLKSYSNEYARSIRRAACHLIV